MTRKERLRRVAILCCHGLRNIAFYKAGVDENGPIRRDQFWVNVNNNFLDIFVLEWCKLFGDTNGKHYWEKVISDPTAFYNGMLKNLNIANDDIETLISEMRRYRDKFVAHLDSDLTMYIPNNLTLAKKSVVYLYDYIRADEDEGNFFDDAPADASAFYKHFLRIGKSVYDDLK